MTVACLFHNCLFQNLTFEINCEQNYRRKAGKGGAGDHSSHSQSLLPGGKARQKYLCDMRQTLIISYDLKNYYNSKMNSE